MRIKKLELENIGCFGRAAFEFADATVVFGENRAGKSTLVYSLFFALFGRHLNGGLTLKDLCSKGETSGAARLVFEKSSSTFRLNQSTDGLPTLSESSDGGRREWRPVKLTDSEELKAYIPLTPETAALTAFFRESELIYFLQDIPKYNKTLLQSLIGIDEILIIKSRFKKALAKAREFKRGVGNASPGARPDPLDIELARRQSTKAELSLRDIEAEYQKSVRSTPENPAVFKLLRRQYEEKQKLYEQARKKKESLPSLAELERKKSELQDRLTSAEPLRRTAEDLQNRIGSKNQETKQIRSRVGKLSGLEQKSECPLCEQDLPAERLTALMAKMENRLTSAEKDRRLLESELENNRKLEKNLESVKIAVQKIDDQIRDLRQLETRIGDLEAQLKGLASDLSSFEARENTLSEDTSPYRDRDRLEERRKEAQETIIQNKVLLRQYEDRIKRYDETQKNLEIADRNALLCGVAYQAMDEAIQMLGGKMLEKVRRSIEIWSRHFTFLHRFDIQMTDRELLPIIQAKGYHYKLNQMSKSERIFLYLMLKLSIGEALGHLGLFILDDPADGLDHKRKQTLAYLLAEVAKKRQVIVTTNDPVFAGFFPDSFRIDL